MMNKPRLILYLLVSILALGPFIFGCTNKNICRNPEKELSGMWIIDSVLINSEVSLQKLTSNLVVFQENQCKLPHYKPNYLLSKERYFYQIKCEKEGPVFLSLDGNTILGNHFEMDLTEEMGYKKMILSNDSVQLSMLQVNLRF